MSALLYLILLKINNNDLAGLTKQHTSESELRNLTYLYEIRYLQTKHFLEVSGQLITLYNLPARTEGCRAVSDLFLRGF